jgi:hypothetical protein
MGGTASCTRLSGRCMGLRFETSDKASAAPKLNWCLIHQLVRPHNCIVVTSAHETTVPAQLAIMMDCHNAVMAHLYVLKYMSGWRSMID